MSLAPFRPRFHIATVLKFTALCCLMLALQHWSGVDLGFGFEGVLSIAYPLGIAVFCALLFMRPKFTAPECQTCGRRCLPSWSAEPNRICPACRHREFPPQQRRRREYTALAVVAILFLMLSFVLLWPLISFMPARVGGLAYPAFAVGLFLVLFASYSVAMIMHHLARSWRMTRPGHALAVARAHAGEHGKETTFGAVSVHVFGPKDPTTMLKSQMETCRNRFATLIGEPLETERPLRILVFGKRDAFDAFFRRAFLFGSNVDGIYVPWTPATIAITTELPAHSLVDPERLVRTLLSYFYLDSYKRCRLPQWLQLGIGSFLACGGDTEELARLNRKMIASLSKGTALGIDDLFHAAPYTLVKLLRDWEDHGNFTKYAQFGGQSWSIVEYLWREEATKDHHARFRGFLRELDAKEPHEETFKRHFALGYDTLLEGWRSSVVAQGIGAHEPLPPHLRFVLAERVIPMIWDRDAKPIERIQAVRELGRAGYGAGADVLIGLLGTDATIPSDEIVWSLEAISGLAMGRDKQAWLNWFDQLPGEAARVADLA
jgi:hypothetical protein